jgi:hypothetical protein
MEGTQGGVRRMPPTGMRFQRGNLYLNYLKVMMNTSSYLSKPHFNYLERTSRCSFFANFAFYQSFTDFGVNLAVAQN